MRNILTLYLARWNENFHNVRKILSEKLFSCCIIFQSEWINEFYNLNESSSRKTKTSKLFIFSPPSLFRLKNYKTEKLLFSMWQAKRSSSKRERKAIFSWKLFHFPSISPRFMQQNIFSWTSSELINPSF